MRIDPFVASAAAAGTLAAVLVVALGTTLIHLRGLRRALTRSRDRQRSALCRDPVTGVATRAALRARLDALDGSDGYAVVVVDLDAFAAVNDRYGEVVGDAVLAEVARRIARLARPCDVVGRLDGDAFAVVRPGRPAECDLARWVETILTAVRAPVVLTDGTRLSVVATAGRARATAGMRPLAVVRAAEQDLIAGRRSRAALDRALEARLPGIPAQAGPPAQEMSVAGRRGS